MLVTLVQLVPVVTTAGTLTWSRVAGVPCCLRKDLGLTFLIEGLVGLGNLGWAKEVVLVSQIVSSQDLDERWRDVSQEGLRKAS